MRDLRIRAGLVSPARLTIRRALLGSVLAVLLATSPAWGDYDEYRIKAAYLLSFARMVEWPAAARPKPGEPLVVGVRGDRRTAETIAEELEGKQVDAHAVQVRALPSRSAMEGCHIVFIAEADSAAAGAWARAAESRAMLSVGESEDFTRRGGVVRFFSEDSRLRFEINPRAADREGLKISSRLLRLARLMDPSDPR